VLINSSLRFENVPTRPLGPRSSVRRLMLESPAGVPSPPPSRCSNVLRLERFRDEAPAEVFASLLHEGTYVGHSTPSRKFECLAIDQLPRMRYLCHRSKG
jgi:hypothetical protein